MPSLSIEENGRAFKQKSQQNNEQNNIKDSESAVNQLKNTLQLIDDHINPTSEQIFLKEEQFSERNSDNQKHKNWKVCILVVAGILILLATIITFVAVLLTKSKSSEQISKTEETNETEHSGQTYDLITLNSSSALCLDGTPAAYYLSRTGDPSKIFILFEGGAWSLGDDPQKTLQSCYNRSKSSLGSTSFQPSNKIYTNGILSKHSENYFKEQKKILIVYCDGSGHQGTRKDPILYRNTSLYFRGHNNTVETFDDLQQRLGLYTKAEKVVLNGESAGAVAMYSWEITQNKKFSMAIYMPLQTQRYFITPKETIIPLNLRKSMPT